MNFGFDFDRWRGGVGIGEGEFVDGIWGSCDKC